MGAGRQQYLGSQPAPCPQDEDFDFLSFWDRRMKTVFEVLASCLVDVVLAVEFDSDGVCSCGVLGQHIDILLHYDTG